MNYYNVTMTFFLNVYVFGNKYKSVFSFLRQLTTWHCSQLLLSAGRAAIDRYLLAVHGPQQQTRLKMRSMDGTDRRTDGRTPYRYIDPAAYFARSVNNLLFALILDAVHCVNKMKTGVQTVLFGQYFTIILCTQRQKLLLQTCQGDYLKDDNPQIGDDSQRT